MQCIKNFFADRKRLYMVMCVLLFLFIGLTAALSLGNKTPGEDPGDAAEAYGPGRSTYITDMPERTGLLAEGVRKEGFKLYVLLGSDRISGLTDTIMLAALDTKNKQVSILQVPRDTMLDVKRSDKKINASYAFGGYDQLKAEFEHFFGVELDGYVHVNTRGFRDIVDLMGGVEVTVPFDFDYEDPEQDLYIHLRAGKQVLYGSEAEQFVRFRKGYVDQDIGRMKAQKTFLSAAINKMLKPATIVKWPKIAATAFNAIKTSLTLDEIVALGLDALGVDKDNIKFYNVPGEVLSVKKYGASYFGAYPDEVLKILNEGFNPFTADLSPSDLHMPQIEKTGGGVELKVSGVDDKETFYKAPISASQHKDEEEQALPEGEEKENTPPPSETKTDPPKNPSDQTPGTGNKTDPDGEKKDAEPAEKEHETVPEAPKDEMPAWLLP